MLSYCLKCKTNRESKNPEVVRTNNRKLILLSKRSVYNSKKFLKEQETEGLLKMHSKVWNNFWQLKAL